MIRTPISTPRRPRPGFTLVELMVAAAISVIIMAVLATAFQLGIDTMRQMRSAGDMANQLRATQEVLRRDLQGDCFVPEGDTKPNNGVKVSNQRFDKNTATNTVNPSPAGGYMVISSGASTSEGTDADGLTSTISTGHALQFTSVLKNNSEQNVFSAVSPSGSNGQTYTSRAAEICYFLGPMTPPAKTSGLGGGPALTLYNLYRKQRLVAYGDADAAALVTTPPDPDVISWNPPVTAVNTMRALANPSNRLSPAPFPPTSPRFGEDVLLSNVISFEVKVNWVPGPGAKSPRLFGYAGVAAGTVDDPVTFTTSSDYPFDTLAQINGGVFDTAGATPPPIRVLAVQIRIRVFDPKLNNARQVTVIQNL